MKKTKFLALALVVALMTMGAGYAYWQEALTINNTVNTGELRLEFAETDFSDADYEDSDYVAESDVEVDNATENEPEASITVNDLYPGAEVYVPLQINNEGTLAAELEGFDVDVTGLELEETANILVKLVLYDFEDNEIASMASFESLEATTLLEDVDLADEQVEPEEHYTLLVGIMIDEDATEDEIAELDTLTFDITVDGIQYNAN